MEEEEKAVIPYKNDPSQNLACFKELQKKEDQTVEKQNLETRRKYKDLMTYKNSYFYRSKIQTVREKEDEDEKQNIRDKFKVSENIRVTNNYCNKCSSNKNFCLHRNAKEILKEKYTYPIVSNSTYGWLPPIDNYSQRNNLNSVTKQFFDNSHLNIHKY
jgi:hypothetical protein